MAFNKRRPRFVRMFINRNDEYSPNMNNNLKIVLRFFLTNDGKITVDRAIHDMIKHER